MLFFMSMTWSGLKKKRKKKKKDVTMPVKRNGSTFFHALSSLTFCIGFFFSTLFLLPECLFLGGRGQEDKLRKMYAPKVLCLIQ